MQHAFKFDPRAGGNEKSADLPHVGYDFPADAKKANGVILVGEAPGAEEARLGHPFVGRSGQLLDKILGRAGIERKGCLVANVFRMQPPGNKVDHFFISRRAAKQRGIDIAEEYGQFGSAFCRAEFAGEIEHLRATLEAYQQGVIPGPACHSLLPREQLLQPDQRVTGRNPESHLVLPEQNKTWDSGSKSSTLGASKTLSGMTTGIVIVALGRTPMWALTGENELLKKIGKPLPCRLVPGATVIPTFHPSFILRGNWGRQDEWLGHFVTALKFTS